MKVKEIEFGVTVGFGSYESSKLSIRTEIEEGEDYHQVLTQLKEEVIKHSGIPESRQVNLLDMIARGDGNQKLLKTAEKIGEIDRLLQSKKEDLEEKLYQLSQVEDKVHEVSSLLGSFKQFDDCSLTEAQKLIKTYEQFKARQNPSEDSDEYDGYSEF